MIGVRPAVAIRKTNMTRLILTTSDSGAGSLRQASVADIVIPFGFRFVGGPLPSNAELETSMAPRLVRYDQSFDRWLQKVYRKCFGEIGDKEIGVFDLCERCGAIALWIDPDPNAQLTLIWLLDYFRHHEKIASKLTLVQADVVIGDHRPEELGKWDLPPITILNDHFDTACKAWLAYRGPTPQAWFNLLAQDLSALPQLRTTVLELLDELPSRATGLGATETRMLELISAGHVHPFDLFPGDSQRNDRRVFGYWEIGSLLDALAQCPTPAVSGLDEGPFTDEMHHDPDHHARYKRSKLALTTLGTAILDQADDFSRHNPIHRWWGGTELTNDHLWRWDTTNGALIAP